MKVIRYGSMGFSSAGYVKPKTLLHVGLQFSLKPEAEFLKSLDN